MTRGQKNENLVPRNHRPDEPHFHDALVFLKARPVVPLTQFEEKLHRKRKWFLCGTFVLTMLVGAVSGLVLGHMKLRKASEVDLQSLTMPEESFSSMASQELATETGIGNVLVEFASVNEQRLKSMTSKRVVTKLRDNTMTKPPIQLSTLSEKEELRRIRDALLTDDSKRQRVGLPERHDQRRF